MVGFLLAGGETLTTDSPGVNVTPAAPLSGREIASPPRMAVASQPGDLPGERVFVGLGANLGDREAQLRGALQRLAEAGVTPVRCSAWYVTEPVGGPPQPDYLNGVVELRTDLSPAALLRLCLAVEEGMGRTRGERGAPRTLDLDILLYGARQMVGPGLVIPHPRFRDRRFVLVPLAEIAPDLVPPGGDRTVRQLLDACTDPSGVSPSSAPCSPPRPDL